MSKSPSEDMGKRLANRKAVADLQQRIAGLREVIGLTDESQTDSTVDIAAAPKTTLRQQSRDLGDYLSLEDKILRDIAEGQKFRWTDNGSQRGLATELGFVDSPGERKARFNILANSGITVDQYAERLEHDMDNGVIPSNWDADIRSGILNVLSRVRSNREAFNAAVALRENDPRSSMTEEEARQQSEYDEARRKMDDDVAGDLATQEEGILQQPEGDPLRNAATPTDKYRAVGELVNELDRQSGAQTYVFNDISELPQGLSKQLEPAYKIDGITWLRDSYICAPLMTDTSHALRTYIHEVGGHQNVEYAIPKAADRTALWEAVVDDIGIDGLRAWGVSELNDAIDDYERDKCSKRELGREVIAYSTELNADLPYFTREKPLSLIVDLNQRITPETLRAILSVANQYDSTRPRIEIANPGREGIYGDTYNLGGSAERGVRSAERVLSKHSDNRISRNEPTDPRGRDATGQSPSASNTDNQGTVSGQIDTRLDRTEQRTLPAGETLTRRSLAEFIRKGKIKPQIDLNKFLPKNDTNPGLSGILHENGMQVASDGYSLVCIRADYPDKIEGRTINPQSGKETVREFPDLNRALQNSTIGEPVQIDISGLEQQIKRVEEIRADIGSEILKKQFYNRTDNLFLNIGAGNRHIWISLDRAEKLMHMVSQIKNLTVTDYKNSIVIFGDGVVGLFVKTIPSIIRNNRSKCIVFNGDGTVLQQNCDPFDTRSFEIERNKLKLAEQSGNRAGVKRTEKRLARMEAWNRLINGAQDMDASNEAEDIRYRAAYHGSPHDFDRFDHSFMGTGEGAQTFGWGTYVTEVNGIAKGYATRLTPRVILYDGESLADVLDNEYYFDNAWHAWKKDILSAADTDELKKKINGVYIDGRIAGPRSKRRKEFERQRRELLEDIDNGRITIKSDPRNLYTVEIPDNTGDNYLEWYGRADSIIDKVGISEDEYTIVDMVTGEDVYRYLSDKFGSDKAASEFLASLGFAGIEYPAQHTIGGRADRAKNYVIFNDQDVQITDHIRFRNMAEAKTAQLSFEEVNARFNEQLQQQINGTLPNGHIYELGMPSAALKAAGVSNLPIELSAARLAEKASSEYASGHPFELPEIENLPQAIANPIAVFDSRKGERSKVVLTELESKGNNFVAILRVQKKGPGWTEVEINDIRSLYPKDRVGGIVDWINNGLLRWVDKKKAAKFLLVQGPNYLGNGANLSGHTVDEMSQQRSNSTEVDIPIKGTDSVTNIIKNFTNPTLLEGEKSAVVETMSEELRVPIRTVTDLSQIVATTPDSLKDKRGASGWYDPSIREAGISTN